MPLDQPPEASNVSGESQLHKSADSGAPHGVGDRLEVKGFVMEENTAATAATRTKRRCSGNTCAAAGEINSIRGLSAAGPKPTRRAD